MKIVTILGARPQFIKAGSLSREILRRNENAKSIEEVIIHTGQHYDDNMSTIFFDEMMIPVPKYFLGVGGGTHGAMTGQMISEIENILIKEKPEWVLVYGDTNSTLAGAIAASKMNIKIAHIEAGLRSFNMHMPEEINRILTDRISSILFCPTRKAMENLNNEGICYWGNKPKVILSGDIMQDGAMFYKKLAQKPIKLNVPDNYILCTIHRAENADKPERISAIIKALIEISEETKVVIPMHPRTRKMVESLKIETGNLIIIEPLGYLQMVWLIEHASLIMTDSGGLQKEAYFFGVPCLTLRDETEWTELIDAGVNILVGANTDKIIDTYRKIRTMKFQFDIDLYGEGTASVKIVDELLDYI